MPDIKEAWDGPRGTEQVEFEIKKAIYCELKKAVAAAENIPFYTLNRLTGKKEKKAILPDNWGAQISLLLEVDESTAINPSVAFGEPFSTAINKFTSGNVMTPQSFSFGAGGIVSSTASRVDKYNPYYSIAFLNIPDKSESVCVDGKDPFIKNGEIPASSSPLITSNLGLTEWLTGAMFTNSSLHSIVDGAKLSETPDVVSIEIKFVVVTSGNINPSWKLVEFTGNNGNNSLLSIGRTRTHDVVITIGPPGVKTQSDHLASQIGQAIKSGN